MRGDQELRTAPGGTLEEEILYLQIIETLFDNEQYTQSEMASTNTVLFSAKNLERNNHLRMLIVYRCMIWNRD